MRTFTPVVENGPLEQTSASGGKRFDDAPWDVDTVPPMHRELVAAPWAAHAASVTN